MVARCSVTNAAIFRAASAHGWPGTVHDGMRQHSQIIAASDSNARISIVEGEDFQIHAVRLSGKFGCRKLANGGADSRFQIQDSSILSLES